MKQQNQANDVQMVLGWIIAGIFLFVTFIFVPLGSLAVMVVVFLRDGYWFTITTASAFHLQAASTKWIGLNQVIDWCAAQWIGWPSLIVGFLGIRIFAD